MPFISSIRGNYRPKPTVEPEFKVTGGDEIITAGGYRIHMFTSVGDAELKIQQLRASSNTMHLAKAGGLAVEYLVLAGGGAGANAFGNNQTGGAGGGGAGGLLSGGAGLPATNYTVTVGAGATATNIFLSNSGSPSVLGSLTAVGGGGGGNDVAGAPGGSGGGSGTPGGSSPTGVTGQGFPGGFDSGNRHGGGGGAGSAGMPGDQALYYAPTVHGYGGIGAVSQISGSAVTYAGGGGAGGNDGANVPANRSGNGLGGPGGGGPGGTFSPYPGTTASRGTPGATNRGAGGGGSASDGPGGTNYIYPGGSGGPGIVIVRYVA